MLKIIDISIPLQPGMPIWPGSGGFKLEQMQLLNAGDPANVSRLVFDVHVGTHVDAPWHFWEDGATVDQLPLETLIGPAVVAYLPEVNAITAYDMEGLDLPSGTERLLRHTRNSNLWVRGVTEFKKDYVALTADAARWVVDHGILLIGIDYFSIQRYQDGPAAHKILLEADVIILEGLDLASVQPGDYELILLPLKLIGAEGAPARAVLRYFDEAK